VALLERFHGELLVQLEVRGVIEEVDAGSWPVWEWPIDEVEDVGLWDEFAEGGCGCVS
jgi:hypothetical protein